MCVTFDVPIRVTTGPRVLMFMVHCTFAGAPVCTIHQSATLEPERTSTVAGVVIVGESKREEWVVTCTRRTSTQNIKDNL